MQDLLDAQSRMQAEADEVVRLLDLNQLLAAVGRPVRVGSSALGLMVRRDIDVTVSCDRLDGATLETFASIGARLMRLNEHVGAVKFRNETGKWNKEPYKYPDGLYLWLSVHMPSKVEWTVDIWLVDEPERQPDLAHLNTLLPRLNNVTRKTILKIKHDLVASADQNRSKIPSALVYEAVMDHRVGTSEEFVNWYLNHHQ
jgi:hypothetical protein